MQDLVGFNNAMAVEEIFLQALYILAPERLYILREHKI